MALSRNYAVRYWYKATSNPLSCNYWFGQNLKLVVVRYGSRLNEPTCKFIHVYISSLHTSLLTFASNRCRFIMFVHVPKVHIARPCIEQFHILGPTQDLTQAGPAVSCGSHSARSTGRRTRHAWRAPVGGHPRQGLAPWARPKSGVATRRSHTRVRKHRKAQGTYAAFEASHARGLTCACARVPHVQMGTR